jgi:hypothetical protein
MRTLFEAIVQEQANRLSLQADVTFEHLQVLEGEDVERLGL